MLQHQSIIVYKKQIESTSNGINPQDSTQITKKDDNINIISQLPQRKNYHPPDDFLIDLQLRIKKGALPSLKQYRPTHHSPDLNSSTINYEQNNGNQRKFYNIQSTHKKPFIMSPILKANQLQSEDIFTPQILSSRKKPSLLNSNLKLIRKNELIFSKQSVNQLQSKTQMDAFWITKCIPVKIIRTEAQQPCLQIQKDGVIKIYGNLMIKFFTYIVMSSSYDSTLQSQMQQFGECTEKLIWKYIRNIIKGLMEIHNKGGSSFNILTLNRILVDYQGNTYIDISKCKFSYSISNEDKKNQFYYLSPQILISNKDSPKNDVWSLGCIILSLMLGKRIDEDIQLHPYNFKDHHDKHNMNEKQTEILEKIDKIKKLKKLISLKDKASYQSSQNTGKLRGNSYNKNNLSKQLQKKYSLNDNKKEPIIIQITQQLFSLMEDCLEVQQFKRPTFQQLIIKYESLRQ